MDCSLFELEIEQVRIMSNLMDTLDLEMSNYTKLWFNQSSELSEHAHMTSDDCVGRSLKI